MKKFDLKYFREAYTSSRWLVRIYEVLPLPNREQAKFKKSGTDQLPPGRELKVDQA